MQVQDMKLLDLASLARLASQHFSQVLARQSKLSYVANICTCNIEWEMIIIVAKKNVKSSQSPYKLMAAETVQLCSSFLTLAATVIDVITASEIFNSTPRGTSFRAKTIALSLAGAS